MKRYIAMAAAAMLFAACSNDDMPAVVDALTGKPVMVKAGVAELLTRAGHTTDNLTTLGLSIHNTQNPTYTYTNVKYTHGATGFVAEGVQPLWQNATQTVTVAAWAPYLQGDAAGNHAFCVQADQTTDDAAQASDFLWAGETVDPAGSQKGKWITYGSGGVLTLSLPHKMSKLVMNVRLTEQIGSTTIKGVTVKGLENACTFSLTDGTVSAPATSVKADIRANAEEDNTFEAIFPPQNAPFTVMIELADGRKYLYENMAGFDFRSGVAYTLSLVIGKDQAKVEDFSATKWNTGGDADLETE